MATLTQIRQGLADTLVDRIGGIPGTAGRLTCYRRVSSAVNLPAVVVLPIGAVYEPGRGPGVDIHWTLDLVVLCSAGSDEVGQDTLDELVDATGPRSIRQAIEQSREQGRPPRQLGLPWTKAVVTRMDGYGTRWDAAAVDHIGAVLRCEVITAAILP